MAAVPLYGLGRVPCPTPSGVLELVFDRYAYTYDCRLLGFDGEERWRRTFGAYGYSSPVASPDGNRAVVTHSMTALSELALATGDVMWTLDLGHRIRSTCAFVDDDLVGGFGNRLIRIRHGSVAAATEIPQTIFFGNTETWGGAAFTMASQRTDSTARNAVVSWDPVDCEVRWTAPVGPEGIVSSDTSGLTISQISSGDGIVLINTPDGALVCVDAASGIAMWRASAKDGEHLTTWRSRPAVNPPHVAVSSLEGVLTTFDLDSGHQTGRIQLDPFGIWSPCIIDWPDVIVHNGTRLESLNLPDGRVNWSLPVGFNGYTRPTWLDNGTLAISGGDPPETGYLIITNPDVLTDAVPQTATYRRGERMDHLRLQITLDTEQATIDLRAFGRSENERLLPQPDGSLAWSGEVTTLKRNGEVVTFAKTFDGEERTLYPVTVDAGTSDRPNSPSTLTLNPEQLPHKQRSVTDSGGAILSAVAKTLGLSIDPDSYITAARAMRYELGLEPHHIWREGAARLFMASDFPLPELQGGREPDWRNVREVIERWESEEQS